MHLFIVIYFCIKFIKLDEKGMLVVVGLMCFFVVVGAVRHLSVVSCLFLLCVFWSGVPFIGRELLAKYTRNALCIDGQDCQCWLCN